MICAMAPGLVLFSGLFNPGPVTTQLSKWSLTSGQSAKALSCSLTEQTERIIVYILHCEKDHVY